jgi:tetratricopeptide (TPR) repeat protein
LASQKGVIIDNAQQFAAKGKIDKAIAEWKKLLAETPQDGNIYNNIADLYLRVNDKASAIDACLKAATVYREAGFELKGVAVLKKVLKVDPNRIDIYEMLADINADRGLIGNAVEAYQQTAKLYMKNGNFKGAISVYQKLAKFDASDPEIPLAIARLYQKQERFREAIFSYEQAEAIYEGKNMVSEARQIIEEIIKIDPSYLKHLVEKEAVRSSIVEMGIERDITLAPPPKSFGSSAETKDESVLLDEMDIFRDIIPDDVSTLTAVPSNKPIVGDIFVAQAVVPTSEISKPHPVIEDNVDVLHQVSDVVVDAHLSEADAYIKYGFNKNAIDKLLLVTALAPMREEAHLRLKEVYLKEGQNDKAVATGLSLADVYEKRGDIDKKEALLKELHEIDPALLSLQSSASKSFELSELPSDFPPLLDEIKGNPFLQAKRENSREDAIESLSDSLSDSLAEPQEESFDLSSAILSDSGAVVQNEKKQHYLETCYQLGVAQKEIGNFAKAIREFEQALDGAGRFQEVLSLLSSCYAEQGDLAHAAAVLQKGVDDPRCKESIRFAVLYDLASIYSQLGEKEKSFSIYKDIYRVDPNFRDVAGKVKEIPYRKLTPETTRLKEAVSFASETVAKEKMAPPVLKEKRRISYV